MLLILYTMTEIQSYHTKIHHFSIIYKSISPKTKKNKPKKIKQNTKKRNTSFYYTPDARHDPSARKICRHFEFSNYRVPLYRDADTKEHTHHVHRCAVFANKAISALCGAHKLGLA